MRLVSTANPLDTFVQNSHEGQQVEYFLPSEVFVTLRAECGLNCAPPATECE